MDSHSKTYALVQSPKKINIDVEGVHGVSPDEHVQSIWNYFAEQLQRQGQVPVISRPVVIAGLVTATISNSPSLTSANLNYTTGPASANSTRVWTIQSCTFSGNQITGTIPPTNTTAYYISVSDTTDTTYYASIASSEVVVLPENVPYKLTVVDGTTDGNYGGGSYYAGTNILLTALAGSDQFLGWIGDTQNVADINASSTSLLMPGQNTTVFANHSLLSIICSGNQIVLSWPTPSLHLQMNTNLNNQAGWTNVEMGSNSPVILPIGADSTFYRLSNP